MIKFIDMDEHEINAENALLKPDQEIMLTILLDSMDSMYDKEKFILDVKSGVFNPSDFMADPSLLERYVKSDLDEELSL